MFIKGVSGVASHPKLHTYEEGYLLPVLTKDELMFGHRHRGLLRLFRDLAGLSDADFDRSYAPLLQNFMEFVQVLPHKSNGILGSMQNYGIARTAAVFQKYCQLRKEKATPLLKFAVFSAALLKDVGRVVSNQRIVLVNEQGEFLNDWNAFSGSMIGQAKFYKMYQVAASYLRIEATVTPMLARQLIPEEMFLWLSSDLLLFSDWLAALLGEEGVGSKELTWALSLIKREDVLEVLNTLDGAALDALQPEATEFGEEFYRWLKAGIESGEIPVNTDKSLVKVVPEGVLLEKQLFKQFTDIKKIPASFLVVYHQVGNLFGIAKKSGADFLHAAYFSGGESASYSTFASGAAQKNRAQHEGMVVDAQHVFLKKDTLEVSSLKSAKAMNAVLYQAPLKTLDISAKLDVTRK